MSDSTFVFGDCCCDSGTCSERAELRWSQTWPDGWYLSFPVTTQQHRPFSPAITSGWQTWVIPALPTTPRHADITEPVDGISNQGQVAVPVSAYGHSIGVGQIDVWVVYATTCTPNLIHVSKSSTPFSKTIPGTGPTFENPDDFDPAVFLWSVSFDPANGIQPGLGSLLAVFRNGTVSVRRADGTFTADLPVPCDIALPFSAPSLVALFPGGFDMIPANTTWEINMHFL